MNQPPTANPQPNPKSPPARRRPWGLAAILLAFVGLSLLYDVTVPLFEKPDELKHFAVIQFIQSQRQLPVVQAGVYKPWDQEGTQPPLYHILSAALSAGLDLSRFAEPPRNPHYADDRSFVWRERGNNNLYLHPPAKNYRTDPVLLAARLARWLSILAGVATILLTYRLSITTFAPAGKSEATRFTTVPLLAAALVVVVPQYLHVSSAITNDSLTVTLAAAGLLLLAQMIRHSVTVRRAVLLGIVLGLGAVTKLSLLYFAPLVALVLLRDYWKRRSLQQTLGFAAVIAGPLVALSGWWYIRNWQLYGDPTALSAHLLYRGGALNPAPTLAQLWQTELVGLELSFWAAFGAGQILLEPWIYTLLRGLKYLLLAGMLLGVWRMLNLPKNQPGPPPDSLPHESRLILGMLALWCLIIFGALLRWMQITPASWGRLLYPALPALAVLSAWGLDQFAQAGRDWVNRTAPDSRRRGVVPAVQKLLQAVPWLVVLALFGLALAGPFRYIRAAYAPAPLITPAQLPPDVQRLDWAVGDENLRLLGYRVDKSAVHPGEWLPVTLYWQAGQPVTKNYSAFVHLLDPAGQSTAQSNSYPDGGRRPTSLLPPGAVLPDRHYIFVPLDAAAPIATRLAFGLFEFDDPARAAKSTTDAAGRPVEPIVDGPPLLPQHWPDVNPVVPFAANFAGQILLTGYDSIDESVPLHPGDSLPLTFYWAAQSPPGRDLNLFIHLVDPATQTQVAGFDGPPPFPTQFWPAGAKIVDARTLKMPGDLPPGTYNLMIGWYNLEDFARLPLTGVHSGDALLLRRVTVE